MEILDKLLSYSKSLGFIDVGVSAHLIESNNLKCLKDYIDNNFNASMKWIERNPENRIDASKLLENAKSVICFAHPVPIGMIKHSNRARFAQGEDYHKILKAKLGEVVENILKKELPNIKTKICVDTSPIFEKAFAANAGIGFIGKHTLLIHPKFGSNIVLGEIITDVDFCHSESIEESKCGTCTKCIEACPTKAITKPYVLNARKCLSYLTIEHKGEIPKEFKKHIKENQYGCDICVNACPYNTGL